MAKKGKKGKKKGAVVEEVQYPLITIEENLALQVKHENLVQRITRSSFVFDDIDTTVKDEEKKEEIEKEWQSYLYCEKIPKPYIPQQIRDFLEKIRHFENEDVENTINWTLSINERSILTQDIDQPDLTETFLRTNRIDFGLQYDARVDEVLRVINRINKYFQKPSEVVPKSVLVDINEVKESAQELVVELVNNFTYRVLASQRAYMNAIDATTAEYFYMGKTFDIHIWTFLDVPIYLSQEDVPTKVVKLHSIKVEMVAPFAALSEHMAIRGVHWHFDPITSLAEEKYKEMLETYRMEKSLRACLEKEWQVEKKMQQDIRDNMVKERFEYEEALAAQKAREEEEAKANKDKGDSPGGGGKAKKKTRAKKKDPSAKKLSKEPPVVAEGMVPYVRKDFLNYDDHEYHQITNDLEPSKLYLSQHEINLRKYQILGGVYYLHTLSKPNMQDYPQLIMTWFQEIKKVALKDPRYNELEYYESHGKVFEITFELPEAFCHWEEPIACFFEDFSTPPDDDVNLSLPRHTMKTLTPVIISDFNINELFTKPRMYDFIQHTMPRIISSFKLYEDFVHEEEDKKVKTSLGRPKSSPWDEKQLEELENKKKQTLSFDLQFSPERLFPIFKKVLPIIILPVDEEGKLERNYAYDYFSDFLNGLDEIKERYKTSLFKDKLGNPVILHADEYQKSFLKKKSIPRKMTAYGRDSTSSHRKSGTQYDRASTTSLAKKSNEDQPVNLPVSQPTNQSILHPKGGKSIVAEEPEEDFEIELDKPCSKWSTANILETRYSATEKKITVFADRLGPIGFAFNRYPHFPLKSWSLAPSEEKPNEVELKLESEHALFRISISKDGYTAFVTDFTQTVKSRKIFLEIDEPIKELNVFQAKFQEKCLNIFAEPDTLWYVDGKFCEKHLSMELHTYDCFALYASMLHFFHSAYNKYKNRRTIILQIQELETMEHEISLVKITPEDVLFVEPKVVKKMEVDVQNAELVPTWRNLEWYPDLNNLVMTNYGGRNENTPSTVEQSKLIYNCRILLHSMRMLSFS